MTTEEAINRIEDHMRVHKIGEYPHIFLKTALDMAIAALRSRSMKLDRRRWEGCECCTAGDGEHRVLLEKWGVEDYCPRCGRPLTEEAWAELEKKTCGAPPDHIFELLQAEREGRLMVMPFKLGDIVYRVVTISKYLSHPKNTIYIKRIKIKPENVYKYVDEVGKSVFLTRDEAETELEQRIGGNDGKID